MVSSFLTKDPGQFNEERDLFNKWHSVNWISTSKTVKLDPYLTPLTQNGTYTQKN